MYFKMYQITDIILPGIALQNRVWRSLFRTVSGPESSFLLPQELLAAITVVMLIWLLVNIIVERRLSNFSLLISGAAVAQWLSSWLAEQEDWGSIPGLATWIFRDWLSLASKSRYGWKIAKSTLILKTTNNQILANILLVSYRWS